jgi:catechol 2,3-dioxygenase-like lactoylglutathione lyase family enzyme
MSISEGKVFACVAVSSFDVARGFYGGTLGLTQVDENPGGVGYECGGGRIFVYVSDTAGSGQATAAMWEVDDATSVAAELIAQGVQFVEYDMPGAEFVDGVHVFAGGEAKVAWFKDPDGNILGVTSGQM